MRNNSRTKHTRACAHPAADSSVQLARSHVARPFCCLLDCSCRVLFREVHPLHGSRQDRERGSHQVRMGTGRVVPRVQPLLRTRLLANGGRNDAQTDPAASVQRSRRTGACARRAGHCSCKAITLSRRLSSRIECAISRSNIDPLNASAGSLSSPYPQWFSPTALSSSRPTVSKVTRRPPAKFASSTRSGRICTRPRAWPTDPWTSRRTRRSESRGMAQHGTAAGDLATWSNTRGSIRQAIRPWCRIAHFWLNLFPALPTFPPLLLLLLPCLLLL